MLRCLRSRSRAGLLCRDGAALGAADRLWAAAGAEAATHDPHLQWGSQVCRRLTAAAAGSPQHADARQGSAAAGRQHPGPVLQRYEDMVQQGTLRRDEQQTEVAARLDALLAQLHRYRGAVASYRDGVQQYKVLLATALRRQHAAGSYNPHAGTPNSLPEAGSLRDFAIDPPQGAQLQLHCLRAAAYGGRQDIHSLAAAQIDSMSCCADGRRRGNAGGRSSSAESKLSKRSTLSTSSQVRTMTGGALPVNARTVRPGSCRAFDWCLARWLLGVQVSIGHGMQLDAEHP